MRLINKLDEKAKLALLNARDQDNSQLCRGEIRGAAKLLGILTNLYSDPRDNKNAIDRSSEGRISGAGNDGSGDSSNRGGHWYLPK
jgi:hypothetical protein